MPSKTHALAPLSLFFLVGCTTENFGVAPRVQEFHYPIAGAISPDGNFLYVVNSDFNLEYNGSLVNVVDLVRVRAALTETIGDPSLPKQKGEADFIDTTPGKSVRINPFATSAQVHTFGNQSRLYITVRGDGSLTWIDLSQDFSTLSCGQVDNGLCDRAHRVGQVASTEVPGNVTLPPLPFNLDVSDDGFITVAHQETPNSRVSLFFDDPSNLADGPTLVHWAGGFSAGLAAVVRMPVNPADPMDLPHWYAFSKFEPFVNHVRAVPAGLQSYAYFGLTTALAGAAIDAGVRAFILDPCDKRYGYATSRSRSTSTVSRSGDALLRLDLTNSDLPVVTGILEMPAGVSNLSLYRPDGCNGHGYVNAVSYDSRLMYVTDVTDWRVAGRMRTSYGPHLPIVDPNPGGDPARRLIYLVNFSAMNIEVVDMSNPGDPRVVYTVGDTILPMVTM